MAVPQYFWFIDPILRILRDAGQPLHQRDLRARVPTLMDLTEEDMSEIVGKTNNRTKVNDRIHWGTTYAGKMRWVERVSRGNWRITDAGAALLDEHPGGIPEPVYRDMQAKMRQVRRERRAAKDAEESASSKTSQDETDQDDAPTERISAAYRELRESVAEELLAQVRAADPAFFELLVLRLLNEMGYGADASSLEPTGGSGDRGIDGVISLDRLGLERVYVQAKRYADGNTVGRPAIQGFLGALTMKNANKGVFITSSTFSREAREYVVGRDGIVLIDGDELAELMMDFSVGVRQAETLSIVEVDEGFFEEGY